MYCFIVICYLTKLNVILTATSAPFLCHKHNMNQTWNFVNCSTPNGQSDKTDNRKIWPITASWCVDPFSLSVLRLTICTFIYLYRYKKRLHTVHKVSCIHDIKKHDSNSEKHKESMVMYAISSKQQHNAHVLYSIYWKLHLLGSTYLWRIKVSIFWMNCEWDYECRKCKGLEKRIGN